MADERSELLAGIQAALTPATPQTPQAPGPDATPAQTEAYLAAVRDAEVHGIMNRQGLASQADRDRLRAEILGCLKREGL
jgi:hypothetical protein